MKTVDQVLIYDPLTSGGIVFFFLEKKPSRWFHNLKKQGVAQATVKGEVTVNPPRITLISYCKEKTMSENKATYGWNAAMGIKLHDKIRQDMKTAMVNKDNEVRDTMRLVIGAFPSLTISMTLESGKKTTRVKKPDEITDEDILNIIRKFVKSELTLLELKKETSSDFMELLNTYLPKMVTPDEIKEWIQANIDFSQVKNPIQSMGTVMKHFGKLADGKVVQDILKSMG